MKWMILILLISIQSFAQNAKDFSFCPHQPSKAEMEELMKQVQTKYFPQLEDTDISIKEFESKNYFLQAKPQVGSLLNKVNRRKYFIMVNPSLYHCSPSVQALEAILVHEFEHIVDYSLDRLGKFLGFTAKYVVNKNFRIDYERQTDMKAIEKGVALGLVEYRLWIYQRLSEKELKKKEKFYLTPEEISKFDNERAK